MDKRKTTKVLKSPQKNASKYLTKNQPVNQSTKNPIIKKSHDPSTPSTDL